MDVQLLGPEETRVWFMAQSVCSRWAASAKGESGWASPCVLFLLKYKDNDFIALPQGPMVTQDTPHSVLGDM